MVIDFVEDTFEEYLSKKKHISSSDIKNFLKSPRYYFFKKYEEKREENSESKRHLVLGSAFHELVSREDLYNLKYYNSQIQKPDLRTKEGKNSLSIEVENAGGKTLIWLDEYDKISKMRDNAKKKPSIIKMMENCLKEVSCYTIDEKTGLKIRLRPDILPLKMSSIGDFKTCMDSSKTKFRKDVYSNGYAISDAFYTHFLRRENYVFFAAEKTAPYQLSIYQLDDEFKSWATDQFRMGLDLLKWSYENNYWCDYMEFEILKECYSIGNIDKFFSYNENNVGIEIIAKTH